MSRTIQSGRFGQLQMDPKDLIRFPQGLLGFPEFKEFCLVDPGDETLILWLQSTENEQVAFPVLEPKIYREDYKVSLSGADLRDIKLSDLKTASVFSVLTIPSDISAMTANLKAPLVVNRNEQLGKQVVLQDNEYTIRHAMFKDLRAHLITIESQKGRTSDTAEPSNQPTAIEISQLPSFDGVQSL